MMIAIRLAYLSEALAGGIFPQITRIEYTQIALINMRISAICELNLQDLRGNAAYLRFRYGKPKVL